MVVVPRYDDYEDTEDTGVRVQLLGHSEVAYYHRRHKGVDWVFVDHPSYKRPEGLYANEKGPYPDNQVRRPGGSCVCGGGGRGCGGNVLAGRRQGRGCGGSWRQRPGSGGRRVCSCARAPRAWSVAAPAVRALTHAPAPPAPQFRFTLLCLAGCEAPLHLPLPPGDDAGAEKTLYGQDVTFVANDWHASLVPVYLAAKYRPHGVFDNARSVLAIHNLRHQVGRGEGRGRAAQRWCHSPKGAAAEQHKWHAAAAHPLTRPAAASSPPPRVCSRRTRSRSSACRATGTAPRSGSTRPTSGRGRTPRRAAA
jgi:hypothetical protein